MSFREYLEESEKNYQIRETKINSKKAIILQLTDAGLAKVKKDFKDNGKFLDHKKEYSAGGYAWKLSIWKQKMGDYYKMFATSGDYTFGSFPAFFNTKLSGNIKAAKDVYNQFIKEYKL
jgi:hypothetical protein